MALTFLSQSSIYSKESFSTRYHNMVFLGEKNFDHYAGPLDPVLEYNENTASHKFLDRVYYETFFNKNIEPNIFEWDEIH